MKERTRMSSSILVLLMKWLLISVKRNGAGMLVDYWVGSGEPAHPELLAVVGGCDGGFVGIGGG